MIKTTLLYNLFQFCIEKLFDELFSNFNTFTFDTSYYSIGDWIQIRLMIKDKIVVLKSCQLEYKSDDISVIICKDFSEPVRFHVRDGVIIDIRGNLFLVYETLFR